MIVCIDSIKTYLLFSCRTHSSLGTCLLRNLATMRKLLLVFQWSWLTVWCFRGVDSQSGVSVECTHSLVFPWSASSRLKVSVPENKPVIPTAISGSCLFWFAFHLIFSYLKYWLKHHGFWQKETKTRKDKTSSLLYCHFRKLKYLLSSYKSLRQKKRYSSKTLLNLILISFLVFPIWENSMRRVGKANCYPSCLCHVIALRCPVHSFR